MTAYRFVSSGRALLAMMVAAVLALTGLSLTASPASAAPDDRAVVGGTSSWGFSAYVNAAPGFGRPNPLPSAYTAPAAFDAGTRLNTFGNGAGTMAADGSASLAFEGTTVNFAPTGGAWLTIAALRAELDAAGNGIVTADVSYGLAPGAYPDIVYDPAQAPERGPQRVNLVTLSGNTTAAMVAADTATWSGLTGLWHADFLAFLNGDSSADVPAWAYASTISNDASLDAGQRLPSAFTFAVGLEPVVAAPVFTEADYDRGSVAWGISTYVNAASMGRPNPLPSAYRAPASFDANTRVSSWGDGSGSLDSDGSASLAFEGSSVNFAATGGGWLRISDVQAQLDPSGNGVVTAEVSYGLAPGSYPNIVFDPAQTPIRGPERVNLVELSGNTTVPVQTTDSATWSGLSGLWHADFLAFVNGDSGAAAWAYAATISNDASLNAGTRLPSPFTFEVGIEPVTAPVFTEADYDIGSVEWGISTYVNAASMGRPNPLPSAYGAPATFDAATRLSSWGNGSGSIESNGSASLAFEGTSVNFAATGGGWLTISDVEAQLDASGNGVVTAEVAYGLAPGTYPNIVFDPAQAPLRGPQRVNLVELAGNETAPVQTADSLSWSGLTGIWHTDFLAFVAGDDTTPAWAYAATISNDASLNAGARLPSSLTFTLGTRPPAVTPTVTLTASPTATVLAGNPIRLTAAVSPAAEGVVRFVNGGTLLGTAAVHTSGIAELAIANAVAGDYGFVAQFVSADTSRFSNAASATVTYSVTAPVVVQPGSLSWGVKSSLRSYVLGGGSISTSQGAGGTGVFRFPQASGGSFNHEAGVGVSPYGGRVTFAYPAHGFSIALSNPTVRIDSPATGVLISDVTYNGSTRSGVEFASLSFGPASRSSSNGSTTFANVGASLTAAGASAFQGFYGAGEALDSLSFVIGSTATAGFTGATAAAVTAPEWTPPAVAPATEGITADQDLLDNLVEGQEFTGTADGFQPNETDIKVVIYSEPTVLATDVVADGNGVVEWTGRLPRGLVGTHILTFQGSVNRGIVLSIAEAAVAGCAVDDVALTWGFKESFRSYVSGSIANGEWTVADGASYEVPNFGWADGVGSYDADATEGEIAFTGSVTFTGHGGILNTIVSNPVVRFDDESTATILLDVTGTTQEGTEILALGIEFATLDLSAATVGNEGGVVSITAAPATLTEAGSSAFGTYEAGEALDPVTIEFTAEDCAVAAPEETASTDDEVTAAPAADLSWILWLVVALLVIAAAVVTVVVVRRRKA